MSKYCSFIVTNCPLGVSCITCINGKFSPFVKCCEKILRIVNSLRNMDLRSRTQNAAVMSHFTLSELIVCLVHLTVLFIILSVVVVVVVIVFFSFYFFISV